MTNNLKPGDIAIIKSDTHPEFDGMHVEIISEAPYDKDFILPNGQWHESVKGNEKKMVIKSLSGKFPSESKYSLYFCAFDSIFSVISFPWLL